MSLLTDSQVSDLYFRDDDRRYAESLWEVFEPYSERDFLNEYANHHAQRFAEMYLGAALVYQNIPVVPWNERPRQAGPDLYIEKDGKRIWIESIVPTPGNGPDRVPDYANDGKCHDVPHEEIKLRYASALKEKHRKYERYWEKGWVSRDSICVIAINPGFMPSKFTELNVPRIAQIVYGGGWPQVTLDKKTMKTVSEDYQEQRELTKQSGSSVSSRFFLEDKYEGISAVLFTYADAYNHPDPIGTDICICHNPNAINPLEVGWLGIGRDYYWTTTDTGGRINCVDHNKQTEG